MYKFCYKINGTYTLTDYQLFDVEQSELPFNVYKDGVKITTAYVRWSDIYQTDRNSLKIQVNEVVARAKQEGFQVIILFVDQAKSAYHIPAQKRPEMLNMKEYILSYSNVLATIFYEESRVTRLIEDFVLNILGPIKDVKPNFKVYSTKTEGVWDENNPFVQAKLALANEEVEEKSFRAFDYHATVINKSSKRPESRNPYGYSLTNDDIELNEYAPIVMFIFYLYSFGHSDKKIAELLNKANTPLPTKNAISWSDSSVRYILNNLWYVGDLTWFARTSYEKSKRKPLDEVTLIKEHHEPLIGPNLWELTQYFRSFKNNKDRMNSPFMLRDLCYCVKCGVKLKTKNMTPSKSKKKYLYYRCPSCTKKVNIDVLHSIVLKDYSHRWSRDILNYKDTLQKILNKWKKSILKNQSKSNESIKMLRYKLNTLTQEHEYFKDIKEAFELQLNNLEREKVSLAKISEKLELLQQDTKQIEIIDRFKQEIFSYSTEEKRSLLLLAIKRIEVDFTQNANPSIEYRLTPYVEIESLIDSNSDSS
ncbi:recombinase family protein [Salinibacillus aidingensis]|uniref:Recombinase family protein n=1 Tax=Salinibacillus aidingensis TaxID=237684 RepID=A0ABP3LAS2_9BACI